MNFLSIDSTTLRIIIILLLAFGSHALVLVVKYLTNRLKVLFFTRPKPKFHSIVSLTQSIVIFMLYFGAFGLILREMGISLTAYLASASVLGLAIAFGSQGIVQDLVTGLTLVFSDLLNVGDMVEISGQTGIIRSIGMRFIILENAMGAEVFIPNRSITNVINYPRGYVRCIVDVILPTESDTKDNVLGIINNAIISFKEQFPGILVRPASIEGFIKTESGKEFLRIKFRIFPGRGTPIETIFRQELLQKIRSIDASYADWMISVNYEVEKKISK